LVDNTKSSKLVTPITFCHWSCGLLFLGISYRNEITPRNTFRVIFAWMNFWFRWFMCNEFKTPWLSDRRSYQPNYPHESFYSQYGNCSETVLFLVKWFRSFLQANINQSQAQGLISHVMCAVWVHQMFLL